MIQARGNSQGIQLVDEAPAARAYGRPDLVTLFQHESCASAPCECLSRRQPSGAAARDDRIVMESVPTHTLHGMLIRIRDNLGSFRSGEGICSPRVVRRTKATLGNI